ncbi:MAG TPA: DUF2157 domain-containing protein, partial [Actinomycetota bacterium]|nr:DUF2157 domain-containing protein [Actinomycetota bacterium]
MGPLEEKLTAWVDAGIITGEQANAIRAAESAVPRRRISFVAEILGYIGAILATVALLMLMGRVWDDFTPGMQVGALLGSSAAMVAAGAALRGNPEPTIDRLAGFLWLASVATFSGGIYLAGVEFLGIDDERPMGLGAGLATTIFATPLWRLRRKGLQQIAVFAPAATTVWFVLPESVDYDTPGWLLA